MGQTTNIDDFLVKVHNEQAGVDNRELEVASEPEVSSAAVEQPEVVAAQDQLVPEGHDAELSEAPKEEAKIEDDKPADSAVADSPIDEYGNPVEKPKTYTEEEVQRMIRDRLSRGKHAEQAPQPQQAQQEGDGFQADPNSEDSWEVQLENFIEKTIDKRQAKQTEKQWKQEQAHRQAEFETKFTSGMKKYQDFHQVIQGKPITDAVMRASMNLDDPAAFIYAVGKMHPQEFDRLARMSDPVAVGAEVGRLDERMRRESRAVSAAPKPVQAVKGDMPVKQHDMPSLETRIQQHAKQKFARGR